MALDDVGIRVPRNGTLQWYAARLGAMSAREVAARAASEVRARVPVTRRRPAVLALVGERALATELVATAPARLVSDAAAVARGSLRFWGIDVDVDPLRPDWLRHPFGGEPWPGRRYRRWSCDPKPIWELHRLQHLFPLAGGAHAGGRGDWADTAVAQVDDWIVRNPPGTGPGWVSGYEAAHRVVTWALALPLVLEAAPPAARSRIGESLARQQRLIEARPSRYSSANNHRLAELLGLLAAAGAFEHHRGWDEAWSELERESRRQTFADGGSREQAAGYFLYVLEILTVAGMLALARGRGLGRVGERLQAMLSWLQATADGDGEPPPVGDDAEDRMLRDDYYAPRRAAALAARAHSVLAGRPSLAAAPGRDSAARASAMLAESGYAVLREPDPVAPIRVVFDVGELGYGRLAAHGHADALSVLGDVGSTSVLRDSGTATYVAAAGRDDFRATAAHNTVVVGGVSQAQPLGPHLWGRRYRVDTEAWKQAGGWDYVRASHDGYRPAVHTRAVLRLDGGLLVVLDRVRSPRACVVVLVWNVEPPCPIAVAAAPPARAAAGGAPFSRRYGSREERPRLTWTATGRDVVFATAVSLRGDAVPVVRLHHAPERTSLEVTAPRRVLVTDDWRADAPQVVS